MELRSFRGPLPSPDILEAYERISPGSANRVISVFENQASHRMKLEQTVVTGDTRRAHCGLACALLVVLTLIGGAVYLGINGHDWLAAGFVAAAGGSVAGSFILVNGQRRSEREQKRQSMARELSQDQHAPEPEPASQPN